MSDTIFGSPQPHDPDDRPESSREVNQGSGQTQEAQGSGQTQGAQGSGQTQEAQGSGQTQRPMTTSHPGATHAAPQGSPVSGGTVPSASHQVAVPGSHAQSYGQSAASQTQTPAYGKTGASQGQTAASQGQTSAQGQASASGHPWSQTPAGTAGQAQGSAYGQTTRRPPIPGQYGAPGGAHAAGGPSADGSRGFSSTGTPVPPGTDDKPKKKEGHGTLKSLVFGVIGGLVGAAALIGSLVLAGVIGPATSTQIVSTDGVQEITIDPNDDDISVANAVAAKALPSVCTVYCSFPEGEGMGSGVIYDNDGNIITNNHVIEDAESISVTYNGKSYDATLVGTDPSSDVAVIHADFGGDSVTPMEIGDSSALQVGDWVMSVGSPFGLENSVSQGIVSALSRSTLLENSSGNTLYTNLIQTDATINPGNSGGALVNDEGKLVGICTLFSSDTESFAGIGYAIPGNYATQVADKIISGETVTHAYIGLTMQTVNAQNASRNGLAVDSGAYVIEVAEGGPAEAAGIQPGDVITGIGGEQIDSADAAILAVRSHKIGDTVEVTVVRGEEEMSFEVTLSSDEALQEEQEQQRQETVDINGQDVSLEDLIKLYEQYQNMGMPMR